VGGYTIPIASLRSEVEVHAIEPVPETRALLERNLERNSLADRVRIWPVAIGDEPGRQSISTTLGGANHLLAPRDDGEVEAVEVEVTTLDALLLPSCGRVDVLKCDIEGGELRALRGAERLLRRDHPDLVVELDARLTRRYGYDPGDLVRYTGALGYRPSRFGDGGPMSDAELTERVSEGRNVLFTAPAGPES
jgi:FkbM family methyltransferase